jgi:hypothetical protein
MFKWLKLFKEIIAVYSENNTEHTIKKDELLIVEDGGHWSLKG